MAFIDTIPMQQIDDDVRAMYARQQAHYGYVPNYAKLFCYRPELMKLWAAMIGHIKHSLDLRCYELVTFVAAHALRSSLCSLAHGAALTEFLPREQVLALARGETPAGLSEADQAVVAFARKVARDAASVTPADVDTLRSHGILDDQVFDITAAVAARAFWTKLIDSLGADGDKPLAALGDDFVQAMTAGRPATLVEAERLPQETSAESGD